MILQDAAATDRREDERYGQERGDELPEHLRSRGPPPGAPRARVTVGRSDGTARLRERVEERHGTRSSRCGLRGRHELLELLQRRGVGTASCIRRGVPGRDRSGHPHAIDGLPADPQRELARRLRRPRDDSRLRPRRPTLHVTPLAVRARAAILMSGPRACTGETAVLLETSPGRPGLVSF